MKSSFRSHLPLPVRAALVAGFTVGLSVAVPGAGPVALGDVRPAPAVDVSKGYWLVAADGTVFPFGTVRSFGSNRNQGPDIVGMGRTADGRGYWMVDQDGDVFHYGNAPNLGSRVYNADDVVGFTARPQGGGYWLVASDGGIFSFGNAAFHGSTGTIRLNQPIVGMASTPTGEGYWLVASDGGIFAFGDAAFHGSTGTIRLNRPIVGMASTPTGEGYWLVASDGGIFGFGDAVFHGSTGTIRLNQPIVGMGSTGTGGGYWLVASDGGIFGFGDAVFHGSTGAVALDQPIIGMVAAPPNHRPAAAPDQSISTTEDTAVSGVMGATDADGDLLTFALSGPPGHGTASVDGSGTFTYTPDTGYSGPDSFVVAVDDGHGGTDTSAVTVMVGRVDELPAATADAATTDEETAVVIDVAANDTGLGDGGMVVAVDATTLDPATEGTAGVTGGDITFVPALNVTGTVAFDYTIADADGDTARATVTVTITPVDDPPTVTTIGAVTLPFGTRDSGPLPFTVADADDPAGSLAVTATSSNQQLVPDSDLDLTHIGSGGNWTLVVVPVRHVAGVSTITLTVSDGTTSTETTFVFEVTPR